MAIIQIGLTTFTVSNINSAKSFFIDKLGLKLASEDSNFGWLEIGLDDCCPEPVIGVGQESPEHNSLKAGTNGVMSFLVDGKIEAEIEALKKKGVKFEGAVQEIAGHVKLALFSDESNNKFFLVEDISCTK